MAQFATGVDTEVVGPMRLVIGSTGIKLFGRGERDGERHGGARRSWRKLHLAVGAGAGEVVARVLTENGAGDTGNVPALLGHVEGGITGVTADGAHDSGSMHRAVAGRRPNPPPGGVIPPRASAVAGTGGVDALNRRDRDVRFTTQEGHVDWRRA